MIGGLTNVKIYVCTQPIDFRKGIDGLQALVISQMGLKPFSGAIGFVAEVPREQDSHGESMGLMV